MIDVRHFDGLYRLRTTVESETLAPLGRSLADYAAAIGGAA